MFVYAKVSRFITHPSKYYGAREERNQSRVSPSPLPGLHLLSLIHFSLPLHDFIVSQCRFHCLAFLRVMPHKPDLHPTLRNTPELQYVPACPQFLHVVMFSRSCAGETSQSARLEERRRPRLRDPSRWRAGGNSQRPVCYRIGVHHHRHHHIIFLKHLHSDRDRFRCTRLKFAPHFLCPPRQQSRPDIE